MEIRSLTLFELVLIIVLALDHIDVPTTAINLFIKPTDSNNVTCPEESCRTLSDYTSQPDLYFIDNVSFIFMPEMHYLKSQIYFENISNIMLTAYLDESVKIYINHSSKITWKCCKNVIVSNLVFIIKGTSQIGLSHALEFLQTTGFLSNLTLHQTMRVQSLYLATSEVQISDIDVMGTGDVSGTTLCAFNSSITFFGKSRFSNNSALHSGGAVTFRLCTINFFGEVSFTGNHMLALVLDPLRLKVQGGGAIYSFSSSITFSGTVHFEYNSASVLSSGIPISASGGAVLVSGDSTIIFNTSAYAVFKYNRAESNGGAIYIDESNLIIHGRALFKGNDASSGRGGAVASSDSLLVHLNGKGITFQSNVAGHGGALYFVSTFARLKGIVFEENKGSVYGGALLFEDGVLYASTCRFVNNSANQGGAVYISTSKLVRMGGMNWFEGNHAEIGGAIAIESSKIFYTDTNNFVQNNATLGGSIYAIFSDSLIHMSGNITFLQNFAENGGAVAFSADAKLTLMRELDLNFTENHANLNGGAIFYDDSVSSINTCATKSRIEKRVKETLQECFLELPFESVIHLYFIQNTAGSAGTVLYGGNLDRCIPYVGNGKMDQCGNRIGQTYRGRGIDLFQSIVASFVSHDNVTSPIASGPRQLCICKGSQNICSYNHVEQINTVRGKTFTLYLFAIGQSRGTVPSHVLTSPSSDYELDLNQRNQSISKTCTPVFYRISSVNNYTSLVLFPAGPCRDIGLSRREIDIVFLPCPDGFSLEGPVCVCEKRLQRYTTNCSVDNDSILRNSNKFWLGAAYDNESYGGLIIHSTGCPFDYCMGTPVLITLNNTDIQCNHNHSGTLCGSCKGNYSIAFGSLHCLSCSNNFLGLMLPFAIAGVALVAILLLIKVSVSDGTMNGIVFYANVVQVNRSVFFPPGNTNLLTVFIAWFNLDLGIETCFYSGMSIYAFTWLQFLFPFYIWLLIGIIIVTSHFSRKAAKLLGTNPVSVLATLLLLSYSKILRTVIIALSVTTLEYPNNVHRKVWLFDGNVPYFRRFDHILLGIFAVIVLIVLFLPYTFILLFGPFLQAYSDWWMFSLINKIKPFMDAYYAPYRKHSRYWTGFLLLVRCTLFLIFALNTTSHNAFTNLLTITVVCAGLISLAWIYKVYDKWYNNLLEAFSILNLCVIAGGTYHIKVTGGKQAVLAYTSVGTTFVTFICLMVFHIYSRMQEHLKLPKVSHFLNQRLTKSVFNTKETTVIGVTRLCESTNVSQSPTTTTIELNLREPFLLDQ